MSAVKDVLHEAVQAWLSHARLADTPANHEAGVAAIMAIQSMPAYGDPEFKRWMRAYEQAEMDLASTAEMVADSAIAGTDISEYMRALYLERKATFYAYVAVNRAEGKAREAGA